jgi:hypothetical protein
MNYQFRGAFCVSETGWLATLVRRQSAEGTLDVVKRSSRAGIEDRWHRPARRGEAPPFPSDQFGPGTWCMDAKHGEPGKLVTTLRHGQGKR